MEATRSRITIPLGEWSKPVQDTSPGCILWSEVSFFEDFLGQSLSHHRHLRVRNSENPRKRSFFGANGS